MGKKNGIQLSKRTVDALHVRTGDRVFWDCELVGFGVRVYASGHKAYVVQSRGENGSKRITLGAHGSLSPNAARKQAAKVIGRIKRGEEEDGAKPITVAELAKRFQRVYVAAHCKPATATCYAGLLKNHILPALGERITNMVGRADVMALHQRLRKKPRLANNTVKLLSRMMTLAESWELMPPGANPCRSVRLYKIPERERFLSEKEMRRLGLVLEDAEADGSIWPGVIATVRLLVLTGCRRSEILSLRWDDVDRTVGVLRLRDSKTGPRMVPLTASVVKVLDGITRQPGCKNVIVGERFGAEVSTIFDYWERIRDLAGLTDVRLHDLRHSYASRALSLGESLPTISRLLGHRHIGSTGRYAHLVRDAEKTAAARVGASIGRHLTASSATDARN